MQNKLRGLYAITPECGDGSLLIRQVEAVLKGGCRMVQFRDKLSTMPERLARAKALRHLTRQFAARLIVNDDLALANLIDADGVHLGEDDGNLATARAILGNDKILGASCYANFSAAQKAQAAGANYVAFGAAYPSPTKPKAPLATVDLFFKAKTGLTASNCAIGGITLDNASPLISAGVDLLAVISDLFGAPDITARATAYQQLFEESFA